MSINFSNYLRSGTITVAQGGTGTTTSTGTGSVVLSNTPNITNPYFTTNYAVDASTFDDQPIFVASNSTNITGLSYAPLDNRVLVVGISPNKRVMIRTGSSTIIELRSSAVSVASTTTSTTSTSGALQVAGGVGIVENLNVGGNATITGNLTVNGTTTTINSSTLSIDDKNIELGSVVAATISATGTIGSITGTGPWTATITNMTTTAGLIVSSSITATSGTGTLYGGSPTSVVVASIVSNTSITYTVTGGTIPTAGTVTNIYTSGNSDVTANGAGITVKAAADKTLYWTFSENRWISNIGFQANNTALGGTLGNQEIAARFFSTYNGNTGGIDISHLRDAAGSDWTTVGTRIQQKIDSTWMAWQQFNGTGNPNGIAWGTGNSTVSAQAVPEVMRLDLNGNLGIGHTTPSSWYSFSPRLLVNNAINNAAMIGIGNTATGSLASCMIKYIGGTSNSHATSALTDNTGSPYFTDDVGSGVLYRNWTMAGTEKLRLNTTGFYVYNSALELSAVNTSTRIRSINSSSEATRWAGYETLHYSGNLAGTTDYGGYPVIELFRSRGTAAAKLGIQNNDQLGSVTGWGWNALAATPAFDDVCRINFHADNTFAAADARGRIEFQTQTGTTLSTAMTIKSDGSVGIGITSPTAKLHVQNSTNAVLLEPTGTWAAKIYQANDATTYNGLVVGARWAADTSTVFEAGSLYGTGAGTAWGSFYKISGIGTHTWGTSNSGIATRMVLDNTGKLLIGTSTAYTVGVSSALQVHGTTANAYINSTRWSADVSASGYIFGKSRGAAVGTRAAVVANDVIGETSYYGDDATNFVFAASITGVVDTTVSTGVVPGRLMFTTASATGVAAERMRIDSAGNVGIGTTTPAYKLQVNGSFAATTKSFVIDHPTKPDMKLRYGSLEGPENGVYIRGRLKDSNVIELPDYWTGLVDESTITVNLTAIGKSQDLWVDDIIDNTIIVGGSNVNCFYTVFAERKDVEKLIVEF